MRKISLLVRLSFCHKIMKEKKKGKYVLRVFIAYVYKGFVYFAVARRAVGGIQHLRWYVRDCILARYTGSWEDVCVRATVVIDSCSP